MPCRALRILFISSFIFMAACASSKKTTQAGSENPYASKPFVEIEHPEWTRNAVIYELNIRQMTEEGTIKAAQTHLPRIKDLGIDIVWLMPIHPIGEEKKKGSLGSPYAVKDYFGVNPELGTLEDLKAFVNEAHALGMYVIFDWIANHTAWDNPMRFEHPEWYDRDHNGHFRPTPWFDWDDIIDLDFQNAEMREYMVSAMKYWVEEVDIDGYRCDTAGYVPTNFWNTVREELDKIKPVFMLGEWESRDLHAKAFDATYAWSWWEATHLIANGKSDLGRLVVYYSWNESSWPRGAYRLTFVSNHDKNSWEGTQFEAYGDALEAMIALSVVGEGMPMIYSGQEAGNEKRLEFFERDPIEWRAHPIGDLYKKLFALKKANPVLGNGPYGATMVKVPNSNEAEIFSFVRENKDGKVFAVFNFSKNKNEISFSDTLYTDTYTDGLTNEAVTINKGDTISLPAWGFKVLVKAP